MSSIFNSPVLCAHLPILPIVSTGRILLKTALPLYSMHYHARISRSLAEHHYDHGCNKVLELLGQCKRGRQCSCTSCSHFDTSGLKLSRTITICSTCRLQDAAACNIGNMGSDLSVRSTCSLWINHPHHRVQHGVADSLNALQVWYFYAAMAQAVYLNAAALYTEQPLRHECSLPYLVILTVLSDKDVHANSRYRSAGFSGARQAYIRTQAQQQLARPRTIFASGLSKVIKHTSSRQPHTPHFLVCF